MTTPLERCRTCGVIPGWHPMWRRAVVQRVEAADAAGAPLVTAPVTIVWRLVYRHERGKVCARFNQAYAFAPLSVAPPLAEGRMPPAPTFEMGDAYEPEGA